MVQVITSFNTTQPYVHFTRYLVQGTAVLVKGTKRHRHVHLVTDAEGRERAPTLEERQLFAEALREAGHEVHAFPG